MCTYFWGIGIEFDYEVSYAHIGSLKQDICKCVYLPLRYLVITFLGTLIRDQNFARNEFDDEFLLYHTILNW